MWFRAAHQALDLPEAGDEEAGMTNGQLLVRVAAHQHERAWAPRWVEDDLAATHERRQRRATDATLWEARANGPDIGTAEDAAQLRADAAAARAEAEQLAGQILDLEQVDAAWAAWYADTAVCRDRPSGHGTNYGPEGSTSTTRPTAPPPRVECRPPGRPGRAGPLRRHQRRRRPRPRQRHQARGRRPPRPTRRRGDRRGRHPRQPIPEPTETADPAVRRRVLPLDETIQAVTKAQDALAEINARRAAEAAHAADEAAREAELEAERREQLNRWDDADTAGDRDDARTLADVDDPLDETLIRD